MATKWSPKDPQDIRDYWVDFTSLLPTGVTITAATVTIDPDQHPVTAPYTDLSKVEDDLATPQVRVRVEGGTPEKYAIQYHVTASDGQQFDLTKTLQVKERTA
jgi:hypothetical protein